MGPRLPSTSRNCGALDVSPCVGGIVDDWRFEPTAEGWEALDAGEGHPRFYRREDMVAIGPDCRAVTPAAEDRRGRPRLVRRLPSRHADECPARNPQPEVLATRWRGEGIEAIICDGGPLGPCYEAIERVAAWSD